MKRLALALVVVLTLSLLGLCAPPAVSAQGQLIPGNRTLAGTLNAGLSTGTGAAYVLTLSPAMPAYVADQLYSFRAHVDNTGPATLKVNALAPKALKKWQGAVLVDLAAGDIQAGREILVLYDGTLMQAISLPPSVGGGMAAGVAGTLQTSDPTGQFAAYAGNQCTAPQVATGLSSRGFLTCADPSGGTRPETLWTSSSAPQLPNAVNLGTLPSGLLQITTSGNVATPTSLTPPAGNLVGDLGPFRLKNSGMDPRSSTVANTATVIPVNLDSVDVVRVANLTQAATVQNPTGTAAPGQTIRFQVCSSAPQTLAWENQWSAAGLPLPTHTTGGGLCDVWVFDFVASTSQMQLVQDVQRIRNTCTTLLTPGTYTNTSITVNSQGCVVAVASGTGPAGGGAASVGPKGTVQLSDGAGGLTAAPGNLVYDIPSGSLVVAGVQFARGVYYQFKDALGQIAYLAAPEHIAAGTGWQLPNESGPLCVKGGSCFAGGGGVTDGTKGDITVSGGGATWTINPSVVTYAKMQNTAAGSVLLGRGAGAAGTPQEITLGTNLSMTGTTLNAAAGGGVTDGDKGDITVSGGGTTWTIDPSTITYAKMQNTSAGTVLLGRGAGAAGAPQEITLGTNLSMTGTTLNASGAGGGNVSNSGTPTAGQSAEWVTATTIQGVATTGTGNYVKATSPTLTTPTIAKMANLTTNGIVTTSNSDGTLGVDTTLKAAENGVQTITSSTTYTCVRNGPSTQPVTNQCKMTFTAAGPSTITIGASGTLVDGDRFLIRLRCTAGVQTIAYAANVVNSLSVTGPTSCPNLSTREIVIGLLYSADLVKLQLIASSD